MNRHDWVTGRRSDQWHGFNVGQKFWCAGANQNPYTLFRDTDDVFYLENADKKPVPISYNHYYNKKDFFTHWRAHE